MGYRPTVGEVRITEPGRDGPSAVRRESVALLRAVGERLQGRDLAAAAATLTFFSGISLVAWLLLAVWSTTWWWGADDAEQRLLALQVLVPDDMGGRGPYVELVRAGTAMGLLAAVVLLFPASFYGEGLRRAALALRPKPRSNPDRFTGWRARAGLLPVAVVLPVLAWGWFSVGELTVPWSPEGGGPGPWHLVLRVVVGFHATWLVLSALLAWAFAVVMPRSPRPRVAVVGGLVVGAFLAGFLHGFQSFLAIPIDVGLPYAGLGVVGGVVAVGLWLYVVHVVLLVGYTAVSAVDDRLLERAEARSEAVA